MAHVELFSALSDDLVGVLPLRFDPLLHLLRLRSQLGNLGLNLLDLLLEVAARPEMLWSDVGAP